MALKMRDKLNSDDLPLLQCPVEEPFLTDASFDGCATK